MTLLSSSRGLVVIDEVQRAPELFKVLRVLLDREEAPAQFMLLGSASPALLRQTLARGPGTRRHPLSAGVEVVPLAALSTS